MWDARYAFCRPVIIGHQLEIETVPQRVARAALQRDEIGANGTHFTLRPAERGKVSVV